MNAKRNQDFDRAAEFRRTQHLYSDPKNYKLYISKKDNPKLHQQIVDGEITLTLQDWLDHGDDLILRTT